MFSSFVIGSNVIRIHVGLYIAYSNIDNGDGNINDTNDADKNGINACQMDASVSDVSVKTKNTGVTCLHSVIVFRFSFRLVDKCETFTSFSFSLSLTRNTLLVLHPNG